MKLLLSTWMDLYEASTRRTAHELSNIIGRRGLPDPVLKRSERVDGRVGEGQRATFTLLSVLGVDCCTEQVWGGQMI